MFVVTKIIKKYFSLNFFLLHWETVLFNSNKNNRNLENFWIWQDNHKAATQTFAETHAAIKKVGR
jgi:hypothetical protein